MLFPRNIKRLTVAATSLAAMLGGIVIATSSADIQSQINSSKSAAASLQDQINSESSQIQQTAGGVAAAQAKLATVNTQLEDHIAQLRTVQTQVMEARDHLLELETRFKIATNDLASNLRAEYENGPPNLVDAILNAHGFSNLLDQVNYIKDAQRATRTSSASRRSPARRSRRRRSSSVGSRSRTAT